uniref:DnaJ homolog subfamily C member 21 n=1 Tax=Elaeophora elaphi TaxID=1147741 RepID=A0A0R3S2G8_9BILA
MRCHYDVLEIDCGADDETIKRSYRKLALKWHPDKNPNKVEECTRYFALIQQAYDVLSDPHERAWYDRHRESILKGGIDEHYEDNSLNLFPYFTSTCYSGFDSNDKAIFDTLASEDYEFLEEPQTYPSFGDENSTYDDIVGPFYAFWGSFCTVRSFAWVDKFNIRDGTNRRVVRAMEKENKKLREANKRERNEEIRALVAFIRKRDPRVHAHKKELEDKRLEQERKTEESRKLKILKQLSQASEYKESEEVRQSQLENLREIEEALDIEFGGSSGESEAEFHEELDFYCMFCEKAFKTEKAMNNHKRSKKHKDIVALLKKHIKEDDACLLTDEKSMENEEAEIGKKKTKKQKQRERTKAGYDSDKADDEDRSEPGTSDNKTNEMFVKNDTKEYGEERANADEINIFLKISKEVSKISRPDNKARRRKERVDTTKSNTMEDTNPKTGTCDRCGEFFESRTKLFAHLRKSGHQTVKTLSSAASTKVKINRIRKK